MALTREVANKSDTSRNPRMWKRTSFGRPSRWVELVSVVGAMADGMLSQVSFGLCSCLWQQWHEMDRAADREEESTRWRPGRLIPAARYSDSR